MSGSSTYSPSVDIPAQVINAQFVQKIENGLEKEAGISATSFIRDILREEGFTRKIFTPITLSDDQIDKDETTDKPKKVVMKEPNSRATYVSFRGMPEAKYFTGPRFAVYFGKIQSQKFTKSIFELKTYDNDIRKILSDNATRDILGEEDRRFIERVDTIITPTPSTGAEGTQQFDYTAFGGLTRNNLADALKMLPAMRIPLGCMLMNDVTAKELLKFTSEEVGHAATTDQYYKGLTSGQIFGVKTLFTIKRDIVRDGLVYFFGTEDFLGKFFVLQDATVYIKHEADMIEFYTYESIGIGIGNSRAMAKGTFWDGVDAVNILNLADEQTLCEDFCDS
jgi:hypothetical protein